MRGSDSEKAIFQYMENEMKFKRISTNGLYELIQIENALNN